MQTNKIVWTTDMEGEWLKIKVDNPRSIVESLKDGKTYDVEIKEHREKRSMDANNYLWVLIGKIAKHYSIPNDEVYRQYVRQSGSYEVIPIREDIADRWESIWGANGIGFVADDLGKSKIPGYHNFRCFYGSHVYNTKEMSRLIDSVVEDCKAIGIETMPPDKLKSLMEEGDAQGNKSKGNPQGSQA